MSEPQPSYIVTAHGPAQSGVVAGVTGYLAQHGCYISSLEQFDDETTQRFFMRGVFRANDASVEMETVIQGMSTIMAHLSMTWRVDPAWQPMRVAVMVSKLDHCLADLLYRTNKGDLLMNIAVVISNHLDLRPMVEREGIRFVHLPIENSPESSNKAQQEQRLLDIVAEHDIELVILARYMQILSDNTTRALHGRCINIHHSFLPGFKGARPYHQAHERGVKLIGATAHYVTSDLDEGPIIAQMVTPVGHQHSVADLVRMGRDNESLALARAVKLHVERRVFIDDNKTVVFQD